MRQFSLDLFLPLPHAIMQNFSIAGGTMCRGRDASQV
jgi:hypothetical protein